MSVNIPTESEQIANQISDEVDELVELYEKRMSRPDSRGTMEVHELLCHLDRKLDEAVEYTSDEEAESVLFGDE